MTTNTPDPGAEAPQPVRSALVELWQALVELDDEPTPEQLADWLRPWQLAPGPNMLDDLRRYARSPWHDRACSGDPAPANVDEDQDDGELEPRALVEIVDPVAAAGVDRWRRLDEEEEPAGDPGDPWSWPDGPERRAALGHQQEPTAPGYCTCGELTTACPVDPRPWVNPYAR